MRWTWAFGGFGFGIWRNRWYTKDWLWTIAFGPFTFWARLEVRDGN